MKTWQLVFLLVMLFAVSAWDILALALTEFPLTPAEKAVRGVACMAAVWAVVIVMWIWTVRKTCEIEARAK